VTPDAELPIEEQAGGKWAETLAGLLELAKKAAESFAYEKALNFLATMEELWETKALPNFSVKLRFELHNEKGRALSKLGRFSEAVEEFEKLLQYCQEKEALPKRAEIFLEIGQLLAKQGEYDRALGHIHRALSAYRRSNNPTGICKSLRNLGVIYIELGEFEDAEIAYGEAIEIAEDNQNHILFGDLNNNLGAIKNMKGDWQGALQCYQVSREVYEKQGEVRKSAYTLNNIGITLLERGQYDDALVNFIDALKVAESIKDAPLILILNINLTDLHLKKGQVLEAATYCQNAFVYLSTENLRNNQLAETKKLAGRISLLEKDFETAARDFDEALDICEELGLQFLGAEVLSEKGNLYLHMGRHMEALQTLEKSFRQFSQMDATGQVEKTEELIGSIEELYLKIFESMAYKVDQKDHYTKGHSDRVANLSLEIARELRLPDGDIKAIVGGALLHDLGKLDIPDDILKKPGRLSKEEYEIVKNHPDLGVNRLAGMNFPWDIIPMIRFHHEQFDGGGYPTGMAGETIPLGARIICVADVFDALTSERPYRAAFSTEKALQVMKEEMVKSFDPVILDMLIRLARSGKIDYIVNRHTRSDEMYHIWALCRFRTEKPDEAITESPVSTPAV
jgi:putative nucleotidyltransferase with HDIG domain